MNVKEVQMISPEYSFPHFLMVYGRTPAREHHLMTVTIRVRNSIRLKKRSGVCFHPPRVNRGCREILYEKVNDLRM
jgi:hypothetical protein